MRPTIMEVNLTNFKYNVNCIKAKLSSGTKILPVLKANAYGTYINTRLEIVDEFDIVAVALVQEGAFLREIGYEKEIFVLNQPDVGEIEDILKNRLTIGVCDVKFIEEIAKRRQNVKIHIEIDTGMNRTGIHPDKVNAFLDFLQQYETIKVEGIYTHMSCADTDSEYSMQQLCLFEKAVQIAKNRIVDLKYIHSAASNGFLNFPEAYYNLVRPGMILYGYSSGEKMIEKMELKPVCELKSKITFLKTVKAGTSIGYGRSFVTEKETKVATIPIGYADGLRRDLSSGGQIVIHGQKAPIIGKICMDSLMVDVTKVEDVKVGDEIWIWDNKQITLEEIATKCDTINYEIISSISSRVPRIFNEK